MKLSMRSVPVPLLFVAGAVFGVLFASLLVFGTSSQRTAASTTDMIRPVAQWQPNVVATPASAPDPMFDTPPAVEPASFSVPARPAAPVAKKAVTRSSVRRHHHPAAKQVATGDLLTAAL